MIALHLLLFMEFIFKAVSICSPERKEFGAPINDTVLSGPVLYSFTSAGEISCQYNCHFHSLCYQYNFHSATNRCELLGRSTDLKIQKKDEWKVRVQKCDSSVCQNGGTCLNVGIKCMCPYPWSGDICDKQAFQKVNANPVCYGNKGESYGPFNAPKKGKVVRVKLVHVSGFLENGGYSGKWGYKELKTLITNEAKQVLVPPSWIKRNKYNGFTLPGFDRDSPELIFEHYDERFSVESGQALRVWGGDDLANAGESNNGEQLSCIDIYFLYE